LSDIEVILDGEVQVERSPVTEALDEIDGIAALEDERIHKLVVRNESL